MNHFASHAPGRTFRLTILAVVTAAASAQARENQSGATSVGAPRDGASDAVGASGPRVRVLVPRVSGEPIVGYLVGSDAATFTLRREDGQTLSLQREAVTRFERSVRPSRKGKGALIGALLGLGLAVGTSVAYCSGNGFCDQQAEGTMLLSFITVPPSALLGLAVSPGEKWESEDPPHLRVGIAPVLNRGAGLRLSVAF